MRDEDAIATLEIYRKGYVQVPTDNCKEAMDIAIKAITKLKKIEQIFNEWTKCGDNADAWAYKQIREVLKDNKDET